MLNEAESNLEDLFRTVDGGSLAPSSKSQRKQKKEKTTDQEEKEEKEEKPLTLESIDPYSDDFEKLLDTLRETLSTRTDLTPCTKENFGKWYAAWTEEREKEREIKARKKLQKLGKKGLTGRELFSIDPNAFKDDEEAEVEYIFEKEEEKQLQAQQLSSLDQVNEERTLDNVDQQNVDKSPQPGADENKSTHTNQEKQNGESHSKVAVDENLFLEEIE